ncbi:MAG: CoA transferase [Candidatus Lambdaproteobacteria bacterium]|nr:CoA transferase [Candidatus Lambdaproteobacteria bacterium]
MRPFEGIKIIDVTHVLAGPFAAYQLGLLGADVLKVEHPQDFDQSRESGSDRALNHQQMGTGYMTQGSNKRAITLNLKHEQGRQILKQLVKDADVFVENFRSGAFPALGLGYQELRALNPRLVYCSVTAFGQDGPRGEQTGYDHVIQALSGMMATTGTREVNPIKTGSPVIDYATGTMAAFAIASALFQRERTGRGQYIDTAMLDVALMLMGSHITSYLRTGAEPKPKGNAMQYASSQTYETKDGLLIIGASNRGQHERLFHALGRPDIAAQSSHEERERRYQEQTDELQRIIAQRTGLEWETYLQARHVPAGRVRPIAESLDDVQLSSRRVLHKHAAIDGIEGAVTVPLAAFKFAHDGPSVESPPPRLGQHTDEVLAALGYSREQIAQLRKEDVI